MLQMSDHFLRDLEAKGPARVYGKAGMKLPPIEAEPEDEHSDGESEPDDEKPGQCRKPSNASVSTQTLSSMGPSASEVSSKTSIESKGVKSLNSESSRCSSRQSDGNGKSGAKNLSSLPSDGETAYCRHESSITSTYSKCSSGASVYSTTRSQNSRYSTAPRFSFGSSSRMPSSKSSGSSDVLLPGPSDYRSPSPRRFLPDRIGYSSGVAFATSTRPEPAQTWSPGPGAYTPEKPQWNGPRPTIGNTDKNPKKVLPATSQPGPGDYQLLSTSTYLPSTTGLGAGAVFCRSDTYKKMSRSNSVPGPCYYSPQKTLQTAPKATFGLATRQSPVLISRCRSLGREAMLCNGKEEEAAPGPGSYCHVNWSTLSKFRGSGKFSVGTASRGGEPQGGRKSTSPGPCDYDLHKHGGFGM